MARQPLKIDDLNAAFGQRAKNGCFCRSSIAIQQDESMLQRFFIKQILNDAPIGLVSSSNRFGPPTDLFQQR